MRRPSALKESSSQTRSPRWKIQSVPFQPRATAETWPTAACGAPLGFTNSGSPVPCSTAELVGRRHRQDHEAATCLAAACCAALVACHPLRAAHSGLLEHDGQPKLPCKTVPSHMLHHVLQTAAKLAAVPLWQRSLLTPLRLMPAAHKAEGALVSLPRPQGGC